MVQSQSVCCNLVDDWKNKAMENKSQASSLMPTIGTTTEDKTLITNEQDDVNLENYWAFDAKKKYFLEFPEALHNVDNNSSI